ncbi:MAG TPA: TRAP transporter fused permease subunit [Paracoccus sp.]|nr:TRAP transporter fused permease subunit [Paracoccus sp. (in: a-proteobacteria)]
MQATNVSQPTSAKHATSPFEVIAKVIMTVLAVAIPLTTIAWVTNVPGRLGFLFYPEQVAALMLGMASTVVFLNELPRSDNRWHKIRDTLLAIVSLAFGIHLFIRFPVLSEMSFYHPTEAALTGLVAIGVVLEGVRRRIGMALIIVFAFFFLYAIFGDIVPGQLQARTQAPLDLLRYLGTDSSAMLGAALAIACFVVVTFVLMGQLLAATGGTEVFTGLAVRLAGQGHGNSAKVAVIASGFMGSISGSAVSNVVSTGVVTIPMMRRAGLDARTAGAIEATASTGGQLMPPVMGAAAFLMAENLRIPYNDIIAAALIPSLLFYFAIYMQIDFMARKLRLKALSDIDGRTLKQILRHIWVILVPFGILMYGLFKLNQPAELAALNGAGALVLLVLIFGGVGGRLSFAQWVELLSSTGRIVGEVILITAIAGMIIGLLATTGVGFALSMALLDFGRSSLFLLLVVTAVICIILGMGLPTTGVYLLLASLAAPSIVQLGVGGIEAHLFVLYFGMLSMITPPVGLAAFAAASLAKGPPLGTSVTAMRFGWMAYLLPFLFVYQPGLVLQTTWTDTALIVVASVIAIPLIIAAMVGHGLRPLGTAGRLVFLGVGLLALFPINQAAGGMFLQVASIVAAFIVIVVHYVGSSQNREAVEIISAHATEGEAK